MYKEFFGLKINPFGNTPDPKFVFETASCSRALIRLRSAILGRRGIAVLSGDSGTGKTTILSCLLDSIPLCDLQSSVILNPCLTAQELLETILIDFGIDPVPASKAQRLLSLQKLLIEGDRKGKVSALFVDEAHLLTPELLEELRLLTNIEIDDRKLLQIVLAGQIELDALLNRWELRQFKQRITVRLRLNYLTQEEAADYIRFRWEAAGGQAPLPFSSEAVRTLIAASEGIPRTINNICDNALQAALLESRRTATLQDVREVLGQFGISWPEQEAVDQEPIGTKAIGRHA